MDIHILTLFPEMFAGPFNTSMLKKAQDDGLVKINIHNLRKWSTDKHKTVDDRPFGGGPGMIMKVDIIDKAIRTLKKNRKSTKTILLDARGKRYTQIYAKGLSKCTNIILIAGHYEGVDNRVHEHIADDVISIGDYVLTGGEIPAMVLIDSIVRLIPGVLNPESLKSESFSQKSNRSSRSTEVEYPQYTRPEVYKGWKVPKILLSGNHAEISKWRKEKSDGKR